MCSSSVTFQTPQVNVNGRHWVIGSVNKVNIGGGVVV
jgi:hypothetical protein